MKRAIVSSLTDAWVWTVASPARKKPTNPSSPVTFPVGKQSTRVPGGEGEKRPPYHNSQLCFSTSRQKLHSLNKVVEGCK